MMTILQQRAQPHQGGHRRLVVKSSDAPQCIRMYCNWICPARGRAMRTHFLYVFVLAMILLTEHRNAFAQQRTFTFVNRCKETVWVGSLGNPGKQAPNGGGWALSAGKSSNVSLPSGWAGRFWGRRNCHFDGNGNGTCDTGDCGNRLQCKGAGGQPPTSLAEFTLNGAGNTDYYDVSLVDGYDFPIQISPSPATTVPGNPFQCGSPTCTSDLLKSCPAELQKRNGSGQLVACKSACEAFNTDQYCCRGAFNTPATCKSSAWPKNYPAFFKSACPTQYSYAYDDLKSTFTCNNPAPNYSIIFCPVAHAHLVDRRVQRRQREQRQLRRRHRRSSRSLEMLRR